MLKLGTILPDHLKHLGSRWESLANEPEDRGAEYKRKMAESDDKMRRDQWGRNLDLSGLRIPADMREAVLAKKLRETPALRVLREWYAQSRGEKPWLMVGGPCGIGKTVAAAWVIARTQGVYLRAGQLKRLEWDKEEWGRAVSTPFLIIDDLGRERDKERSAPVLLDLLDERPDKATYLPTNLDQGGFLDVYEDPRLHDRMAQLCMDVWIDGASLRRNPGLRVVK